MPPSSSSLTRCYDSSPSTPSTAAHTLAWCYGSSPSTPSTPTLTWCYGSSPSTPTLTWCWTSTPPSPPGDIRAETVQSLGRLYSSSAPNSSHTPCPTLRMKKLNWQKLPSRLVSGEAWCWPRSGAGFIQADVTLSTGHESLWTSTSLDSMEPDYCSIEQLFSLPPTETKTRTRTRTKSKTEPKEVPQLSLSSPYRCGVTRFTFFTSTCSILSTGVLHRRQEEP